jgi:hypothetical protein
MGIADAKVGGVLPNREVVERDGVMMIRVEELVFLWPAPGSGPIEMRQMAPESFGDLAFGDAVVAHLEPRRIGDSLPLSYQADEFERHCIDFLRAAAEAPIITEPQTAPEVEEPHVVGHHEITLEAGAFDVQVEIMDWKGKRYAKVLLDQDEEMPELCAADAAKLSRLFNAVDEAIRTGQGADLGAAALGELLSEDELSVIHSALRLIQTGGHLRKATAALSAEGKIHEALAATGNSPTAPSPVQPLCACGHRYDHHGHGSMVGGTACKEDGCKCGEYRAGHSARGVGESRSEAGDRPTPVESKDGAWTAELLGRELHQSAKEGGFASDELRWEDLPPENRANYMILATKALDVLAPEPLARMEAEEELGEWVGSQLDPAVDVIGRGRVFTFGTGELVQLLCEVAGASSRPLLEDNPEYVFPSEKVLEAIREFLAHADTNDFLRAHSLSDEGQIAFWRRRNEAVLRGVNPTDLDLTAPEAKALIDSFMGGSPAVDALNTAQPKLEAIIAAEEKS